mgnify:CR=1 FL=1
MSKHLQKLVKKNTQWAYNVQRGVSRTERIKWKAKKSKAREKEIRYVEKEG